MKRILSLTMLALLCLAALNAETASPFSVARSTGSQLKLAVSVPALSFSAGEDGGQSVREIRMEGALGTCEPGQPELPVFSTMVAIPPRGSFTLSYSYGGVEYSQLDEPKICREGWDGVAVPSGGLFPSSLATASEPAILRDFRVVQINVYPCQYDPATKRLATFRDIEVTLDFTAEPGLNELPDYTGYSQAFRKIYEAQIANFADYRNLETAPSHARILLIHGNNSDPVFLTKLNEFATWKRQKGYAVNVVSTSQTGGASTTSIKNYIQSQYNNPETRPDFIILLGDTSGNYPIPAWFESYSGRNGEGDYPYTHLAGSDLLGDAFIGRISVQDLTQLITILNKVYTYEKNINNAPDAAAWLNRMLLIGDRSYSGISTVYNSQYIHEMSHEVNPDYTYIENYTGGFPSTINNGINQGVSFFNYRGYINMSGWSPSNSLNNGPRLPHAVMLTCGTGSYASQETTSEAFIRLGTEAVPRGALTAIGMATIATKTMLNNALATGIFDGIFLYGMRSMGEALLNGRLYLHNMYGQTNTSHANSSAHWCNLMGDPTVETFIGIPQSLVISAPDSIPRGTPFVDIQVSDPSLTPVEGVSVTIYNDGYGDVVAKGFTDESGMVTLLVPNFVTGDLLITASKHDHKPSQQTLLIDAAGSLVYLSKTIADDGSSGSSGNGDSFINAGETIALSVELHNTTTAAIDGITGVLSTADPLVTVTQANSAWPAITAEQTAQNSVPFLISFDRNIPAFHNCRFTLELTDSAANSYQVLFYLGGFNADLSVINHSVSAGGDNVLDPSENGILTLAVKNSSVFGASDIYGELTALNDLVEVTDNLSYFGSIPAGMNASSIEGYGLFAQPLLIPGMMIPFRLRLYNADGFEQIAHFSLPIGTVAQNTPLGPDEYGYFIYDVSDTAYPDCPSYEWIEIVPSLGGSGTQITGLHDPGVSDDEGDQNDSDVLETIDLPFTFRFYGVDYDQITVCVNGFIAFGVTNDGEFRNGRMPGGQGPSPMVAPFWDDLVILSGGGIYQWYDSNEHRFIIQYNNLKNGYNRTSEETFQVIFYDPLYYPSSLGDGIIKIQYKVFNNVDIGSSGYSPTHGKYATVGIRDHTNLRGLEYTFANQYPPAAQPLDNGKALLITTVPVLHQNAYLVVGELILNDANGNSWLEPGETAEIGLKLNNLGINAATNVNIFVSSQSQFLTIANPQSACPDIPGSGHAFNVVPFTVTASPDCTDGLVIPLQFVVSIDGNEWTYPLNLTIRKPTIVVNDIYISDLQGNVNGLADPGETFNLIVNYLNNGFVDAYNLTSNIMCLSEDVTLVNSEQLIPTIPAGGMSQAVYEVSLSPNVVVGNNLTFYLTYLGEAVDAQNDTVLLNVGTTGMSEDFEDDNGAFEAQPATNGWEWGTDSTAGAHSGTKVWGTRINQQYSNNANWTLTSPPVFIGSNFVLEFYHKFDTEQNYDGGNVKISTNNGVTWTLLTPENGYTHQNLSALNGPGYSGNSGGWTQARFSLAAYPNQTVRFRWTFASDGSVQRQGWYLDDVQTTGFIPFAGKVSGTVQTTRPDDDHSTLFVQNDQAISIRPNSAGAYTLYLPEGEHNLTASGPGYHSQSVFPVNLSVSAPSFTQDYLLTWFAPATDLEYSVANDSLSLFWAAPAAPPSPQLSYKVFRKQHSGPFELVAIVTDVAWGEIPAINGEYRYYVLACYDAGESVATNIISVVWPPVDADDPHTPPLVSCLYQNYPNPFNPSTTVMFDLAEATPVTLSVYNVKGQLVRRLLQAPLGAGTHRILWDGTDESRRPVSSGIYFFRIESPALTASRKAVLLK